MCVTARCVYVYPVGGMSTYVMYIYDIYVYVMCSYAM